MRSTCMPRHSISVSTVLALYLGPVLTGLCFLLQRLQQDLHPPIKVKPSGLQYAAALCIDMY